MKKNAAIERGYREPEPLPKIVAEAVLADSVDVPHNHPQVKGTERAEGAPEEHRCGLGEFCLYSDSSHFPQVMIWRMVWIGMRCFPPISIW